MFITADGESGKRFGNETIRLTPDGSVAIKIPEALVAELGVGSHLAITAPVTFSYRESDWLDWVSANQAVRYDISFDSQSGRWYLDASWKSPQLKHIPTVEQLRSQRHLGVDLNADHLAACIIDAAGNPVGPPFTIPLELAGLSAPTRDARLREAISELLNIARRAGCAAIAIENLGFTEARATGRETMGRGKRGKTFRGTVAAIPTATFRERLGAMRLAATCGLSQSIRLTPRNGVPNIGLNPCNYKLRPTLSPATTVRQRRSDGAVTAQESDGGKRAFVSDRGR